MTELKKCSLEVIGEVDVGSVPSAFGGSSGVVPATPLVWEVRGTLESKGEESLGMRTGRNMVVDGRKGRRKEYKRPGARSENGVRGRASIRETRFGTCTCDRTGARWVGAFGRRRWLDLFHVFASSSPSSA